MWRNKSYDETVQSFIEKLVLWQLAGYMTGQVWNEITQIVDSSVLPPETQIPTVSKRWENDDNTVPAVARVAPCTFEEECK